MHSIAAKRYWVGILTLICIGIAFAVWHPVYAWPKNHPSSNVPRQQSTDDKAMVLQRAIGRTVANFGSALSKNDIQAAKSELATLQGYQNALLRIMPRLSDHQKKNVANTSMPQAATLETDIHSLPDYAQMDAMMVLAGYAAIQDAAE